MKLKLDEFSQFEVATWKSSSICRASIWEALSLAETGSKNDAASYQERWGSADVDLAEHRRFKRIFGKVLTIWTLKEEPKHTYGEPVFGSGRDTAMLNIVVPEWTEQLESISSDVTTMFVHDIAEMNFFPCPKDDCDFRARNRQKLEDHIKAHDRNRVRVEEKVYDGKSAMDELIAEKVLPADFRQTMAVFWDIESILVPSPQGSIHVPVSIGLSWNFGDERTAFISRDSMEPESLRVMVKKFLDKIKELRTIFHDLMPQYIKMHSHRLLKMLHGHREGYRQLSPSSLARCQRQARCLQDIQTMRVISFRGERYDLPVLKVNIFESCKIWTDFPVKKNSYSLIKYVQKGFIFAKRI